MSQDNLGGRYFNSAHENETWLKKSLNEIFAEREGIEDQALLEMCDSAARLTPQEYMDGSLQIEYSHGKGYTLTPLTATQDGVVCIVRSSQEEQGIVLFRGSLFMTDDIRMLDQDQLYFINFFASSLSTPAQPELFRRDMVGYCAVKDVFYENSHALLQYLWPEQMVPQLVSQGIIDEESTKPYPVKNGEGAIMPLVKDKNIAIDPNKISKLKLVTNP